MKILTHHNPIEALPAGRWPGFNQNGIIRSFVARRKKYLVVKRGFDIVFSALFIIGVLSWLLPLVAMLIRIDSKGPVFFRQRRIGKNGVIFQCLKFRTMLPNDEADERQVEENDERITRVGRLLRRLNIDELPQFFNVFTGDMSVVGPRPHMIADCIRFSFVISAYSFRSLVRPGITGWAQVHGYHGPTHDYESIIVRYYWDARYVRKSSLWLDLKIIGITFVQSFRNFVDFCFVRFSRKKKELIAKEMNDARKAG